MVLNFLWCSCSVEIKYVRITKKKNVRVGGYEIAVINKVIIRYIRYLFDFDFSCLKNNMDKINNNVIPKVRGTK